VDTTDLFKLLGLRKAADLVPVPFDFMTIAVPTISVNPSVGVSIGAGMSTAVLLGPATDTMVSSASFSFAYTTKNQMLLTLRSVVLRAHNDWELIGDWRYYDYSEPTYGLGTAEPTPVSGGFVLNGEDTQGLPGAQPLQYRWVKLHETVFRRVKGAAYAGVGYHLDHYYDISDEALALGATPPAVTSHFAYSQLEGFDPSHYTLSGVSLNGLYETRDHTLDPQRGTYARVTWRVDPTWLGSSRPSSVFDAEYRTYVGLSKDRPRHLIAFWGLFSAVTSGEVPYLTLPAVGYDTRGRSGRGYAAGRFRGTSLMYGEVEYRFPLTRSGILGGVAFANATTASRPAVNQPELGFSVPRSRLFDAVQPGGGAGLRLMLDRQARMNLAVDAGFGVAGSGGVYVSVGEAF
jgi:outer membrane protein assembly factor BamA